MTRLPLSQPKPLVMTYQCRWRYSPGTYCSMPITPPERFCPKHKTEDRKRLAELRKEREERDA